jgi:hypothetical protein
LKHFWRPDSDFASLRHRDAAPQKLFCSSGPGAFSTPREAEQESFLVTFFQKSNCFLFSFPPVAKQPKARYNPGGHEKG